MKFNPSEPRPYTRHGAKQPGRWEIDLRGTLDNGFTVKRERRVFPASPSAGKIGKRQAAVMAFEEWQRWNRCGQVLRPGEKPVMASTGTMAAGQIPTFAQFAPDFLEFCASPNAGPRGANREITIEHKRLLLKVHVLPVFGSVPMDRITTRDVDCFVINKTKEGYEATTVGNMIKVLRRMMMVAKRYELIGSVPHIRAPISKRQKIQALDPDESARFLAALPKVFKDDFRAMLLELYLRTGMRCGEGLGLYPADFAFDADRPRVQISRSWGRKGYGPPKGGKPRTVPLSRGLAARIEQFLAHQELSPKDTTTHLFRSRQQSNQPADQGTVLGWVRRAGCAAKIRQPHTHMLRHTFGTECARRGVPLLTLKEWMGHADVKTTMGYLHLVAPDHLRWGELLDE
jgi:integrase